MSQVLNIKENVLKYYQYFILPLILLYLSFNILDGNNGLLAHKNLDAQIALIESRINDTKKENSLYEIKISLIKGPLNNRDLIDEEVRSILGYGQNNNEFIVYFD